MALVASHVTRLIWKSLHRAQPAHQEPTQFTMTMTKAKAKKKTKEKTKTTAKTKAKTMTVTDTNSCPP